MRTAIGILAVVFLAIGTTPALADDVILETELGPLVGTLLLPESDMSAVALIIAGSGPTDRDGNSSGIPGSNNSLKMLAEALAEKNIGSLRFDKRLIGESASTLLAEADLRFDNYVSDANLWVEYLGRKTEEPVFVIGHSEGALIGLLAAKSSDVAGVVSIAGPGRPAGDVILEQLRPQLPPELMAETENIVAELEAGRTVPSTPPSLAALFRDSVQPYLVSWFAYDPAESVSQLDVPVLLVYGSTDIQVPTSDGRLLAEANDLAQLEVIDGMNHVLKMVPADRQAQISSYGDPSLPVSGQLVDAIVGFVSR